MNCLIIRCDMLHLAVDLKFIVCNQTVFVKKDFREMLKKL